MEPQKFKQSYKCDCFQPENYCNCANKIVASDVLLENVRDVANSLVEVMDLCGIYITKAKSSIDVIIYYFLHFEEIIHRIDSVTRKRLNKEDLLHDLSRKCDMNRREAQMAYSIIKRAFKALYHGTDMGGVPNNRLSDKLTHTSECLWLHAAQRSAQLYASYDGLFYACQKDLECKIKIIYKNLYNRITRRIQSIGDLECTCIKCLKRIAKETLQTVKVTTGMHDIDNPYETIYLKEQEEFLNRKTSNKEENDEKFPCSCPPLKITKQDNVYRKMAKSINRSINQGPFDCRWFPISKEEYENDDGAINVKLPEEVSCPSCGPEDEYNSEDCKCTCADCICKSDDDVSCDELWNENNLEENFSEEDLTTPSEMEVAPPSL
ncbi:uncharacterized protein ACRADG_003613 [Cochliomyia hominivorax]